MEEASEPLSRSHLSPGAATNSHQPPGGERRKQITVPEPSACPCVQLQLHRQMAVHAWLLYHLLIIAAAPPHPPRPTTSRARGDEHRRRLIWDLGEATLISPSLFCCSCRKQDLFHFCFIKRNNMAAVVMVTPHLQH